MTNAIITWRCNPSDLDDNNWGPVKYSDKASVHVTSGLQGCDRQKFILCHNSVLHDVIIYDECVIGMEAVAFAPRNLEKGSASTGSIVPQGMNIPAGKLVIGNPAKVIKDVSADLKAWATHGVEQYKELTRHYLQTMKEIPR
jgi:carbonic anhydrase/acetyltransferase-like protein (isoleucine patch superfamily)